MNDKTGQLVECLEKAKLANLNVFSPNEEFDWRISVNSEVPGESATFRGKAPMDLISRCVSSPSAAAGNVYLRQTERSSVVQTQLVPD